MWYKKLKIINCLILIAHFVNGQSIKDANKMMIERDYTKAIKAYEKIINTDKYTSDEQKEVLSNLAFSYKQIHETQKAERIYNLLFRTFTVEDSKIYLDYAQVLATNTKYVKSRKYYKEYLCRNSSDSTMAKSFISAYSNIYSFADNTSEYDTNLLPFNTDLSDFSPVTFDGKIFFCSSQGKNKKSRYNFDRTPFVRLFEIDERSISAKEKRGIPEQINVKSLNNFNDGPITFLDNAGNLIITINSCDDAGNVCQLKLFNGVYNPQTKDIKVTEALHFNSDSYLCSHPTYDTINNRLFFVSDMPGGYGGTDIYYAEYQKGEWSNPMNLGAKVNTTGNESFPFISKDGILYFSSNGHAGLGGLDIFSVDVNLNESPQNLGKPFNSEKDDFGLLPMPDLDRGLLSTNRFNNGYNDDILYFSRSCKEFEVAVLNERDEKLNDVTIIAQGKDNKKYELVSNSAINPKICIEDINKYEFMIAGDSVIFQKIAIEETKNKRLLKFYINHLNLVKNDTLNVPNSAANKEISQIEHTIENLVIDFEIGKFTINKLEFSKLNRLSLILKKYPSLVVQICSHADSRSSLEFNKKLSEDRASEVKNYLIKRGVKEKQLKLLAMGENSPVIECQAGCSEEVYRVNRQTDFKVLKVL